MLVFQKVAAALCKSKVLEIRETRTCVEFDRYQVEEIDQLTLDGKRTKLIV